MPHEVRTIKEHTSKFISNLSIIMTKQINNPCEQIAQFYEDCLSHEHTDCNGRFSFSTLVGSGNKTFSVTCQTEDTEKYHQRAISNDAIGTTVTVRSLNFKQNFQFISAYNKSVKLNKESGKLSLVDAFGNNNTMDLPIPKKKEKEKKGYESVLTLPEK
jgi:hypothetical protein